jgi:hypothetical protein
MDLWPNHVTGIYTWRRSGRIQYVVSYVSITHAVSHSVHNQLHHTATLERPDHEHMRGSLESPNCDLDQRASNSLNEMGPKKINS